VAWFDRDGEERVSEADEEKEERRKLEIKKKTLEKVIMYDDYLETQT